MLSSLVAFLSSLMSLMDDKYDLVASSNSFSFSVIGQYPFSDNFERLLFMYFGGIRIEHIF